MTENDALAERIAAELIAARARTTALTSAVDEADLVKQHSPLMSPLVWDLAHIANQEELWLLREVGGRDPLHPEIDPLYDAFEHPRAERPTLPLLAPDEARGYCHEVRGRVLDLSTGPAGRAARPVRRVADRQRLRVRDGRAARGPARRDDAGHPPAPGRPAGAVGATAASRAGRRGRAAGRGARARRPVHDGHLERAVGAGQERPAHEVDVAGFYLDTAPVTNAAYAEFIADGGYDDPRFWTAEGWAHRQRAGLTAPLFWRWEGQWVRVAFGRTEPIAPSEPVMHVCWYEADAYARWAGRRLPTEAEWEKAARHDPAAGRSRRYPWGDAPWSPELANLGQRHLRPAPAGSYPAGAAPSGARQLIGDVWEWTSSDFRPYPGFVAWPYKEYSEVFFGPEYKVLRGGAFGVSPVACRGTFRNWDYPIRRQIFAGFARPGPRPRTPRAPRRRPPDVPSPRLPGPPATLRSVLIDPPHGLYRQAWAPRRQRHGTVNADGFGIGWYAEGDPVPARYRRGRPIWATRHCPTSPASPGRPRCWRRSATPPRDGRRRAGGGPVRVGPVAVQP